MRLFALLCLTRLASSSEKQPVSAAELIYRMAGKEESWSDGAVTGKRPTFVALDPRAPEDEECIGYISIRMPLARETTTKQREQKAPVPEEEEYAKIVHLYVREDWRGRRVATNLLRRLVEHIGQQKSPSIVATCAAVDSRNGHAVKAYTNAGFILSTSDWLADTYCYFHHQETVSLAE
ncbi:hypothetical protein FOZ61_000564 [Perkinsus olseni]|uniref:N-acetyltransferase domain-containing protein n=1 Tax=Perkinsus olseni TaxID=32597 RepID=A0A7J6LZP9_PEROL|nr:hypothetical protein FOZ61_000564 [Perkinsus olseni]KAF4670940.1 hypothetical protein FOL46_000562 [Perkinsus olseni]